MSEPNCEHSNLPGGMGCVMCEAIGFRAHQQSLTGCRCIYDKWNNLLSTDGCPVHDARLQQRR